MRELPALFSTLMVEAILENRKKMTRRTHGLELINKSPDNFRFDGFDENGIPAFEFIKSDGSFSELYKDVTPRYQIGDIIWVREKFEIETDGKVKFYAGNIEVQHNIAYRQLTKWKPSIHLFKKDARIWLEVTNVRCERLQDITEADAIAEGVLNFNNKPNLWVDYCPQNHYSKEELEDGYPYEPSAVYSFLTLWESINGIESVRLNPWVFVYEFKRINK